MQRGTPTARRRTMGVWFPAAILAAANLLTLIGPSATRLAAQPTASRGGRANASAVTIKDLAYGKHLRHRFDLYPGAGRGPHPVFVFFHGGGFVAGDKGGFAGHPLREPLQAAGITCVSANYRFVRRGSATQPAVSHPAPMHDGARVIQFLRAHAGRWDLDTSKIVVSGSSAGAMMALWIGLRDDLRNPRSEDPVLRESSRVSGVLAYSGPTTALPDLILRHVGGNPAIHPSLKPLFDVDDVRELRAGKARRLAADASALTHVSADDPPLYLRYETPLSPRPLPPDTAIGVSIHHANFGKLLQQACQQAKLTCVLKCKGVQPKQTELQFIQLLLN